ncbi:hypothetical protein OIE68_20895 [Nocardia vinacea]|uniref:hypothetical protein n=1 Tax=Nocardia vinacea TaxID=96468 RepID=UPI002E116EE3|nr:hypothetical protein OIE68_20895 [Nocardia vinacea]
MAFDVARNTKSGIAAGTIVFDARINGAEVASNSQRTELCNELTRVANAVVAALPLGA